MSGCEQAETEQRKRKEFLVSASQCHLQLVCNIELSIGSTLISLSVHVHNLGVAFSADGKMTPPPPSSPPMLHKFADHQKSVEDQDIHLQTNLPNICLCIVFSRLEHCNALLESIKLMSIDCRQRVQNAASI